MCFPTRLVLVFFSRTHHDSDHSELTEEKENSRRPLAWIAGGTAAALLLGAGTFWATGGMHQQPSTLNVATETTGEHSAASPSSARSVAPTSTPSPTWSAKQPHVTYADPTDLPVAPGTVEYVTEDAAPQAIDVAPSHNPADSEVPVPQQNAPAPSTPTSRVSTDQGNPTDTGTDPAVEPTVQSTQGQEAESTEQPAAAPEALPTTPVPSSPDPVTPETPSTQNIPHATVPAAPATVPHEATAQAVPGSVPTAP